MMYRRGSRVISIICVVLSVLLAGFLAYMIYTDNQQQKSQTAVMEALQAEARPYENELTQLKRELSNLEDSVSYSSEDAEIMVGFVATGDSDIEYIKDKADTYNFSPVLILDCTLDMDIIEKIIESADTSWEIMLYAPTFSEEMNDLVLSVLSYLEDAGREHTGVFFLRSDYSTDANIQLLLDDEFIGYTSYHESSPKAGQTEDGAVYFDYSYLNTSGTSVTSRLSSAYTGKSSIIVAFDMASINSGDLSETYVTSLLDTIEWYTEYDDCSFSTVAAVTEELSSVNSIEADNQASYEKQAAEIQVRIDELEEIIDGIYDGYE
ncbi:MAG: hypothetical protein LUC92_00440 [Clostridiales bacterium]|nr:hypothetical protein [Clostridiales bacterium]